MNTRFILISALLTGSFAGGCKNTECGEGTVERDGHCQPANETIGNAMCGPFTELQGDKCVPMFPPTECDPGTTMADTDQTTGVTTCIGTGGGGCGATFACPAPAAGKQTICGQLYDFETNATFAGLNPTGAKCPSTPTADGPCSLNITAYDAIAFGTNPQTAVPLVTGPLYIDDCGRYRVPDITIPSGPFIGLGIDDAVGTMGPMGITNTVGVAIPKSASMATKDFEAWIVKKTTTDQWVASGAPALSGGYYVNVFRQHSVPMTGPVAASFDNQAGVQSIRSGSPNTANDYYFTPAETTRRTVLTSATVTGANGTVLLTNAAVSEGVAYGGLGVIPGECTWGLHAGASLPNIVFIQLFRPSSAPAQTCTL